jgi:peptide/nickel transport system substrate-binding protein
LKNYLFALLAIAMILAPAAVVGAAPQGQDEGYTTYTVVAGDTLAQIAAAQLGDGSKYLEIVQMTNAQGGDFAFIEDPDLIEIGWLLAIPGAEWTIPTVAPEDREVITVAYGGDVDTLDPQSFKSILGYYNIQNTQDQLLDYVLQPGPNDTLVTTLDVRAMGAESYDVNEEMTEVTFYLRKDAKFANGRAITAKDWKYTFDRGVEGPTYTKILADMLTITDTNQIQIVDDYTLDFKFNKPNPLWRTLIVLNTMSVLDSETFQANATEDDPWSAEWAKTNHSDAGPYILKTWEPGVEVVLEPNPNYWNADAVNNAGIVVKIIPNPEDRVLLLKNGDVDITYEVAPKELAKLEDDPDINVLTKASTWNWYMGINNTIPPLDNKLVRQAICYAVPYDTIIDKVMYGYATPQHSPITKLTPTSDYSFWQYETDLDKAKDLLTQAGYPDGFDTDLDILIGRAEDEEAAVWIQANLAKIGINVTINKMTQADWQDKINNFEHPLFMMEWFSWVNDPFYHMYWNWRSDSWANFTQYNNERVDEIMKEGMYLTDAGKRAELSREAQELILEDAPWAFLYSSNYTVAAGKDVKGYAFYWDQNPRWMYLYK